MKQLYLFLFFLTITGTLFGQSSQKFIKAADAFSNNGLAMSTDGNYLFRSQRTNNSNTVQMLNASDGSHNKYLTGIANLYPQYGGGLAVDSKGAIYVSNVSTSNTASLYVFKWTSHTATPTKLIEYVDGSAATNRPGYDLAVFVDGSNNGYILMHKNNSDQILYWQLSNGIASKQTPDIVNLTVTGGGAALAAQYARISIVDATHFWIDGWGANETPLYCTITGSGYTKPTKIEGIRLTARADINQNVGGATEFTFKGRRYGVFAANNHGTTGTHLPGHHSKIFELDATAQIKAGSPVIAKVPAAGLGSVSDVSHFVKSEVRVNAEEVHIYSQGGFNNLGGWIFHEVAEPTFPISEGAYLAQFSYNLKLTDIPTGATVYYTTDGSAPTYTSTEYNPTNGINFGEGEHSLKILTVKEGYFPRVSSRNFYVVPFLWNGELGTDWRTVGNWTLNISNKSLIPGKFHSIRIPTSPTGGRFPIITYSDTEVNDMEIETGASVTINNTQALSIGGKLTNKGTINILGNSVFNVTGALDNTGTIKTALNLPDKPSIGGTIELNSSAGEQQIPQDVTGFENLIINTSVAKIYGTNQITVSNNLTVNSGKLLEIGGERSVTAKTIVNDGNIAIGFGNLNVSADGSLTNNGTILTRQNLPSTISTFGGTVNLNGDIDNESNGQPQIIPNKTYNNLVLSAKNGVAMNQNDFVTVNSNMTIDSNTSLDIGVSRGVQVKGNLTNNAGVDKLILRSAENEPNGSLIFNNTSGKPSATVEMFSKGYSNTVDGKIQRHWQFFGVPFNRLSGIEHIFYGSYVRVHNEAGTGASQMPSTTGKWIQLRNQDTMRATKGYEIVQNAKLKFTFAGELYNTSIDTTLAYTPSAQYPGQHILSNPYSAAIDITKINFGINVDATVYLYNTGSREEWIAGGKGVGNNSGQYVAAPKETAGTGGIPKEIPSMQGFLVKTSATSNLNIPYSTAVINNTTAQRAPMAEKAWLRVAMESESGAGDVLWLINHSDATKGYDNGWDATKLGGDAGNPLIYLRNETGLYQINSVPNIDDTDIIFRSGAEDTNYTLTLTHGGGLKELYESIYLLDRETGTVTKIDDDVVTYTFFSSINVSSSRFKILTSIDQSDITTDNEVVVYSDGSLIYLDNRGKEDATIEMYDMVGRKVGQYSVNASLIKSIPIQFNTGAYIVRIKTSKTSNEVIIIQ